jgi:hypothetical protein
MLLPRGQNSWNCGYFLGAIALEVLSERKSERVDIHALRELMAQKMGWPISITQAVAAASWLFLLKAVSLDDNGMIVKCT